MRGRPKLGLRVAFLGNVVRVRRRGGPAPIVRPAGWYIQVNESGRWVAIMDLRFVRQKDALRGMQSLTAAGLDSYIALKNADPLTVREVACRFLEW